MICLSCDSTNIKDKRVKCEGRIKDELLDVVANKMVCEDCGESFLNEEQMASFRRILADAYRQKHDLLTSSDIKSYRKSLGLNQIDFARLIGAGDSSVKRWESNRIQDKVYDMIIRSRCDPSYISDNIVKNLESIAVEDKYTGYCKFRLSRYLQLLSRIVPLAPSPIHFFKVLFLMDEDHFDKFESTISGLRYSALDYGPVPDEYRRINDYILRHHYASKRGTHDFSIHVEFNHNDFSDSENETISQIIDILKSKGKEYCFEKSHESDRYKQAFPYDLIQFNKA